MKTFIVVFSAICTVCYCLPAPEYVTGFDKYPQPRDESLLGSRDATLAPLKFLYVPQDGNISSTRPENIEVITVAGTGLVSEEAVNKAAMTVAAMVRYMPGEVFSRVAKGKGVGIFAKSEGLTAFPETANRADTTECEHNCTGICRVTCLPDGRKFSKIGGLTLGKSYVVDNNVLCNRNDGYRHQLNVLGHEFAHQIMNRLDKYWRERITHAYTTSHDMGTWKLTSYAMRNKNEYWAEASGAFFLFSRMFASNGGMNRCGGTTICPSVSAAREFLHANDPEIFTVLQYVYTDNRPYLNSEVKPCM